MKKYNLTITFCFILNSVVLCQEKSFHIIQEALNFHISEFKSHLNHYDNIYIVTTVDENISLPEHVFQIGNVLNPKFLKKKDQDFLIKLVLYNRGDTVKMDAINFRIIKRSNRKIDLLNMSNGQTYVIK